jgi:hypothetical protein
MDRVMTEASATPATPATPEAATARLSELSSNPEWSSKVDAQDPVAFADFQKLTTIAAGNPTTETLAGALSDFNGKKLVDQFLAGPLPAGYPDLESPAGADLAQMLRGEKQITPELRQAVQKKLNELTADAGWRTRFEARDQTALREFQLACGLLASDVSA